MFKYIFVSINILLTSAVSPAATVTFPVYNTTKTFEQLSASAPEPLSSNLTSNYWCAFSDVLSENSYRQLLSMNIQIKCYGKYSGGYVYHLNIPGNYSNAITTLRSSAGFVNIIPVAPSDKIDNKIWTRTNLHYINLSRQTIRASLRFFNLTTVDQILRITSSLVDSVIYTDNYDAYQTVDVIATCTNLYKLAESDMIMAITCWEPPQPTLFNSRELTGVNRLQSGFLIPINTPTPAWMTNVPYTGDSIWFNNSENGGIYRHLDFFEFNGRDTVFRDTSRTKYTWRNLPTSLMFTYHGIMTASTALGNGWASTSSINFPTTEPLHWRGVAPKAMLIEGGYNNSWIGDVNNRSFAEDGNYYGYISSLLDLNIRHHEGGNPSFNNLIVTGPGNDGGWLSQHFTRGCISIIDNSKNTINAGSAEKYGPELVRAEFSGNWFVRKRSAIPQESTGSLLCLELIFLLM